MACCDRYYGDYTFEEAYLRTGRDVSITVTAHRGNLKGESSYVLNHITTPQVLIASAVATSCALPGIMQANQLLAKDADGKRVPFAPEGIKHIDGSVKADLPTQRLTELFNVNQFIVSQVNPHIVPFLPNEYRHAQVSLIANPDFGYVVWATLIDCVLCSIVTTSSATWRRSSTPIY